MSWKSCTACRKPIALGAVHWVCSVSTCNRRNTDYHFCSVSCWDSHVATLNHRDAWAVETRAPTLEEVEAAATAAAVASSASTASAADPAAPARAASSTRLHTDVEREILIVVSKMKKYIKDRSGMSTSDAVADALSDHVRALCDLAIQAAGSDGRRTVLDRDVPRLSRH
jgi:histone H3/H4